MRTTLFLNIFILTKEEFNVVEPTSVSVYVQRRGHVPNAFLEHFQRSMRRRRA